MASGEILFSASGNLQGKVVWGSSSNGSSANSSTVSATLYARRTNSATTYGQSWSGYVAIGGNYFTINFSSSVSVGSNWVQMATGTVVINHNDDGTKMITIEGSVTGPSGTSLAGVTSQGMQNVWLDTIPRQITGYTLMVYSVTMNTVTVKWTTNETISAIKYGINQTNLTEQSASGKSGSFTISNLDPKTSYRIYVNFKRADSGLYLSTNVSTTATTNDNGNLIVDSAVNIGDNVSVKWTNPTGATLSLGLYTMNGSLVQNFGNLSSSPGGPFTQIVSPNASSIFSLTPTSNQITLKFILTSTENGKSYTAEAATIFYVVNSNPSFSNFTYIDNNSATVALTGNNQALIKGHSSVLATITAANRAIAKNSAIMQLYRLTVGTKTVSASYSSSSTVNIQANNIDGSIITVYAVDSRGNSTSKSVSSINYINYNDIVLKTVTAERTGGVGTNVTLTYNGSIWNNSFGTTKNSIQSFKYYYKKTNSSTWIQGNSTLNYTLSGNTFSGSTSIQGDLAGNGFTQTDSFDIRIEITDKLSTSTFHLVLGSGKPVVAYHKKGVAINKKFDTSDDAVLQVDGKISSSDLKLDGTSIKTSFSTGTLTATTVNASSRMSTPTLTASTSISTPQINDAENISYAGTPTDNNISFNYVSSGQNLYRSGLYTVKVSNTWYNLINVRHRNGLSDGTNYGLQIAKQMQVIASPIQARCQNGGTWSSWADFQVGLTLYENTSGSRGTISLSNTSNDFSYLEIFYGRGGRESVRVNSPNGKTVQITYTYLANSTTMQTGTEIATISGSSIVRGTLNYANVTSSTTHVGVDTSGISIYKVIGYY